MFCRLKICVFYDVCKLKVEALRHPIVPNAVEDPQSNAAHQIKSFAFLGFEIFIVETTQMTIVLDSKASLRSTFWHIFIRFCRNAITRKAFIPVIELASPHIC